MIPLYCGHDPRETVGTHVFIESVLQTTSLPVQLMLMHKPMVEAAVKRKVPVGTNAFTVSRFLIPWFQEWTGPAIFCDGADMLCRADLKELFDLYDPTKAVQVVKHQYRTKHARKYVGTSMEADNEGYDRKNWASLMLFNCGHYGWRRLTPTEVAATPKIDLLQFKFLQDKHIGELPATWNWLADEYGANEDAKLLHWTAGVPLFPAYADAPHADEYRRMHERVNHATN